jgi:hypothetical protein
MEHVVEKRSLYVVVRRGMVVSLKVEYIVWSMKWPGRYSTVHCRRHGSG